MSSVVVEARPAPVRIETEKAAVVVVDMQNDFASPGGMFDRAGIDTTRIAALVAPIGLVLDHARHRPARRLPEDGIPPRPLRCRLPRQPDLDQAHPSRRRRARRRSERSIEQGADSRHLEHRHRRRAPPQAEDVVVYKSRYGGFHGTELEQLLHEWGVDTLIVVGTTTSVCVETTVREAVARDFHCVVLEDCVAEPIAADQSRSNQDATIEVLERLFASIATRHRC